MIFKSNVCVCVCFRFFVCCCQICVFVSSLSNSSKCCYMGGCCVLVCTVTVCMYRYQSDPAIWRVCFCVTICLSVVHMSKIVSIVVYVMYYKVM